MEDMNSWFDIGKPSRIIMKCDATDRQIELAKEFYPNAEVIRECDEKSFDNHEE
jgi:hypothetical protein